MKQIIAYLLALWCFFHGSALFAADPLTISYFERPPYYFTTETGAARGILVDRTRNILSEAGIEARFVSLSLNQILYVVRHTRSPHCSVGWLKKPERELFARFSEPIYQNRPLVLLTTRTRQQQLRKYRSLSELFADPAMIMVRNSSYSYGAYVDKLIERFSPSTYYSLKPQSELVQTLHADHATYMLISPEEVSQLIATAGLPESNFITIPLEEIPAGNFRYLMCNRDIDDELLEKLNQAIRKLYPECVERAKQGADQD